ncbi:hypothetical protein ACFCYC_14140 [Streptomyces sp. NPDC056402]|uniref:hypothetical protein n=1 Tax=Streptomyces sp. NPDC056402 TaxID=3345810 RepID=UPI0035E2F956
MMTWGWRALAAVGSAALLSGVVLSVRSALEKGWGDVDPGGLAVASLGLVTALVGLWVARRRHDPAEVAVCLARSVVRVEQEAFAQLLGRGLPAATPVTGVPARPRPGQGPPERPGPSRTR